MSFGNNTNTLTYGNLTANGSFGNLSSNIFSSGPSVLDYLVVGGGGSGGTNPTISDGYSSGGGAGGGGAVLRSFNTSSGDVATPINASTAGVFTIIVGAHGSYPNNAGSASSITANNISISAAGGNAGSPGSSTTGGAGGASGNGNAGFAYGKLHTISRTLCSGTPPNATAGGQFATVHSGRFGGPGGGAGGAATTTSTFGTGLDSGITLSSGTINYGQGGNSDFAGGPSNNGAYGMGGAAGAGDNEIAINSYSGNGNCQQLNYSTVYYSGHTGAPMNGHNGAVYLRWSGNAPSDYTGGTLSVVNGDNLLSYTTAGTYTLIF